MELMELTNIECGSMTKQSAKPFEDNFDYLPRHSMLRLNDSVFKRWQPRNLLDITALVFKTGCSRGKAKSTAKKIHTSPSPRVREITWYFTFANAKPTLGIEAFPG